jgi:hypothetical protein
LFRREEEENVARSSSFYVLGFQMFNIPFALDAVEKMKQYAESLDTNIQELDNALSSAVKHKHLLGTMLDRWVCFDQFDEGKPPHVLRHHPCHASST